MKFIATVNGWRCARSYTPVSDVLQTGTADFVIKIYRAGENPNYPSGGRMTQYLESLQVGDRINMSGPGGKLYYFGYGKFSIKRPSVGNILKTLMYGNVVNNATRKQLGFIAGGTGIAPCYHVF